MQGGSSRASRSSTSGDAARRRVPRRRLDRHGVPDGGRAAFKAAGARRTRSCSSRHEGQGRHRPSSVGAVIGDINSRRGRIQAMEDISGDAQVVRGARAAVGDVRLRRRPAVEDPGPGELLACSSTPTPRFPRTSPRRSSRRPGESDGGRPHRSPGSRRLSHRKPRPNQHATSPP